MKATITVLPLLSALAVSCASTSSVPINPNQAVRTSPSLVAQGASLFEQMKQKSKISRDPAKNAAVRRVATRLRQVIPLQNADWEFVVFDNNQPNAFALPGGKVGINSGIFQITQNDAGLATVIGHEIAHVILNHGGKRQQQGSLMAIGGLVLDGILSTGGAASGTRDIAGSLYGAGTNVGVALPHSRSAELEADKLGTIYMARAGYNPNEAVALWRRFGAWKQKTGAGQTSEFLSTHPVGETRIRALEAFMPQALQEYRPR